MHPNSANTNTAASMTFTDFKAQTPTWGRPAPDTARSISESAAEGASEPGQRPSIQTMQRMCRTRLCQTFQSITREVVLRARNREIAASPPADGMDRVQPLIAHNTLFYKK